VTTSASQYATLPSNVRYPPFKLCTDNAAMVGAAGWFALQEGRHDNLTLDVYSAMEGCR